MQSSKPEENETDDPEKIIKDEVPLTQTRSESDIGDDDKDDGKDDGKDDSKEEDREAKQSKGSTRSRWIYGIGSFLLLCSLAGVIVGVLLDSKARKARAKLLIQPTFSPTVSSMPTSSPSDAPSGIPSATPSTSPSGYPTSTPTATPSQVPSDTPTMFPTALPTPEFFPQNPEPRNPPSSYFNYDPNSNYGPHRWNRVNTRNSWLREFSNDGYGPWAGHLDKDNDVTGNKCGAAKRKQSPKNLSKTRAEGSECEAGHEIRTKCATHPLSDDEHFDKQILPHKLSIQARRRLCLNVTENGTGINGCEGRMPPRIDLPKYAAAGSDYSDMMHFDIKIPGEHTLEGETFDAEIQMLHVHLTIPRVATIAVPIRAKEGGFNMEFQWILNEFQTVFDNHKDQCEESKRARNLRQQQPQPLEEVGEPELYRNATTSRKLQASMNRRHFNPYVDELMPSMFFYRYDGSITEPPCLDITYWVIDEPAVIGMDQLKQLKTLLFGHVDKNCNPTSVHNKDQEAVRPIQPLGENRVIQHCPTGSFRSDESKGRPPGKNCRA